MMRHQLPPPPALAFLLLLTVATSTIAPAAKRTRPEKHARREASRLVKAYKLKGVTRRAFIDCLSESIYRPNPQSQQCYVFLSTHADAGKAAAFARERVRADADRAWEMVRQEDTIERYQWFSRRYGRFFEDCRLLASRAILTIQQRKKQERARALLLDRQKLDRLRHEKVGEYQRTQFRADWDFDCTGGRICILGAEGDGTTILYHLGYWTEPLAQSFLNVKKNIATEGEKLSLRGTRFSWLDSSADIHATVAFDIHTGLMTDIHVRLTE